MKANRFREVLKSGGMPVGHMVMEFGSRGIAKLLESADLDFVVYDMEHSGIGVDRMYDLLAWSKAAPYAPFVRVPQCHYHFMARIMDAGALGIMIPIVETQEQARDAVNAIKYAPLGKRGVCLGVAHNDFLMPDPAGYFREANDSTVVICQIESELGVKNVEAIAATPGVDVLWIGHFDLTQSMGIPGQFHHPRFREALRTVVAAAHKHGRQLGIQPGTPDQSDEWIALGFNVISWSADVAVYQAALTSSVQRLRERAAKA